MIMGLYEVPKKDIVWIQAGQKHTLADVKANKDYYWNVGFSDNVEADGDGNAFVGGETRKGWFRIPAKYWKTKKTPITYKNSTKVVRFMGFNGKYYSVKLTPTAFTKVKKIIDSYNKKWDVKELAKKKTPTKKPATRKRKTPAKKPATRKRKTPAKKPATRKRKTPAKKAPVYKGKRPSPSISATAVKAGTKRRGGSGKMYVAKSYKINGKKVQRWVQA
jgi:hypothetical protein